jgi:hypothetical protein
VSRVFHHEMVKCRFSSQMSFDLDPTCGFARRLSILSPTRLTDLVGLYTTSAPEDDRRGAGPAAELGRLIENVASDIWATFQTRKRHLT